MKSPILPFTLSAHSVLITAQTPPFPTYTASPTCGVRGLANSHSTFGSKTFTQCQSICALHNEYADLYGGASCGFFGLEGPGSVCKMEVWNPPASIDEWVDVTDNSTIVWYAPDCPGFVADSFPPPLPEIEGPLLLLQPEVCLQKGTATVECTTYDPVAENVFDCLYLSTFWGNSFAWFPEQQVCRPCFERLDPGVNFRPDEESEVLWSNVGCGVELYVEEEPTLPTPKPEPEVSASTSSLEPLLPSSASEYSSETAASSAGQDVPSPSSSVVPEPEVCPTMNQAFCQALCENLMVQMSPPTLPPSNATLQPGASRSRPSGTRISGARSMSRPRIGK